MLNTLKTLLRTLLVKLKTEKCLLALTTSASVLSIAIEGTMDWSLLTGRPAKTPLEKFGCGQGKGRRQSLAKGGRWGTIKLILLRFLKYKNMGIFKRGQEKSF